MTMPLTRSWSIRSPILRMIFVYWFGHVVERNSNFFIQTRFPNNRALYDKSVNKVSKNEKKKILRQLGYEMVNVASTHGQFRNWKLITNCKLYLENLQFCMEAYTKRCGRRSQRNRLCYHGHSSIHNFEWMNILFASAHTHTHTRTRAHIHTHSHRRSGHP